MFEVNSFFFYFGLSSLLVDRKCPAGSEKVNVDSIHFECHLLKKKGANLNLIFRNPWFPGQPVERKTKKTGKSG